MFYDASDEQVDFPSYEPYNRTDNEKYQEVPSQINSKKYVQIIVVIIIILALIIGIFLSVFFSLKRKEDGGSILICFFAKERGVYKLFNRTNLKDDDFEIEDVKDSDNTRLLDITINNNIKLEKNEKELERGYHYFKIKFNKKINSLEGMFENIQGLISVDFSKFYSKKVVNMNNLFKNCTNLEVINFQNFNAEKLISMDQTFEGCSKLTILDLSSFSTPKLNSMISTFKGCSNLLSLNIKNFIFDSDFDMSNTFEGCDSLIHIEVPDNNKNILKYQKNINNITQCEDSESGCIQCNSAELTKNINISICVNCHISFFKSEFNKFPLKCNKCIENCRSCKNEFLCEECNNDYYLTENLFCEENKKIMTNLIDTTMPTT